MSIILMTDFGNTSFVGQMKGVINKISPGSKVIDLSHSIEKFNILEAGFTIYNSIQYFPGNSIFVCIVDPGVGSDRKPIIIKSEYQIFIGPDNGLFTLILDNLKINSVTEIIKDKYIHEHISSTFHGRDIFAPISSMIDLGAETNDFGIELNKNSLIKSNLFYPKSEDNIIIGNILFADSFGNLITNIHSSYLNKEINYIEFMSIRINSLSITFSDVDLGNIVAYIGSCSYLELGINQGNLQKYLNIEFNLKRIDNPEYQVRIFL